MLPEIEPRGKSVIVRLRDYWKDILDERTEEIKSEMSGTEEAQFMTATVNRVRVALAVCRYFEIDVPEEPYKRYKWGGLKVGKLYFQCVPTFYDTFPLRVPKMQRWVTHAVWGHVVKKGWNDSLNRLDSSHEEDRSKYGVKLLGQLSSKEIAGLSYREDKFNREVVNPTDLRSIDLVAPHGSRVQVSSPTVFSNAADLPPITDAELPF